MKTRLLCSATMALAILIALSCDADARGVAAPPPNLIGLGNTGDWLPNGPLFGFDAPLGWDFFGGDGPGGNSGFEFGGPVGGAPNENDDPLEGPAACQCPDGDCIRYLPERCRQRRSDYCLSRCACEIRLPSPPPPAGSVVEGSCRIKVSFKTAQSGCALSGSPCTVRYGATGQW